MESELRVGVHVERALWLFTPAGERSWVDGWDPVFPAGEDGDGARPGTVFTTEHDGTTTVWTVVARDDRSVRYARVTPGRWSGLVEVRCRSDGDGATLVSVSYDLTALSDDGRAALAEFAAG